MSEEKAKKSTTKPTLLPIVDEIEADQEEYMSQKDNKKAKVSMKKEIATSRSEVCTQAAQDAQNGVPAATIMTPAKSKKGETPVAVDPATFKHKLDNKTQQSFFNSLPKDQQKVLINDHKDVKDNLNILLNTVVPAPKKPQSAYFLFAEEYRPKFREKYPEATITVIATKIGEAWSALDNNEKYQKMHEKLEAAYNTAQASHAILLEIQTKLVDFYIKKNGLTEDDVQTVHPVQAAEFEKENAKPKTGLPWPSTIPISLIKKGIVAVPSYPGTKGPSTEVATLIQTVVEAFVVWLGQQLTIKTVRSGKRTVQPPYLKLVALEPPQSGFLRFFPSIAAIEVKSKKKSDKSMSDDDENSSDDEDSSKKSKQSKLKLVPNKGKNVMTDDDEQEKKPKVNKVTSAQLKKAEKEAEAEKNKQKMAAMLSKGSKSSATAFDDDEEPVILAKKTTAKKEKVDRTDPLFIPTTGVTSMNLKEIAALKKEKDTVSHIQELTGPSGEIQYIDTNTGDEASDKQLKKFKTIKAQIFALQKEAGLLDDSKSKKRKSKSSDETDAKKETEKTVKKQKTNKRQAHASDSE